MCFKGSRHNERALPCGVQRADRDAGGFTHCSWLRLVRLLPDNTAPVCRSSAPYRSVMSGTGSRSPTHNPFPLPRMDHKSNEITGRSTCLRSACEPFDGVVGKKQEIGAMPFGEWSIEMKPGVGRPLDAPGPTGATAPAIFSGEIYRSHSSLHCL